MKLIQSIRQAGSLRRWLRLELWWRGYARCDLCAPCPEWEWEAICDCFIPEYRGRLRLDRVVPGEPPS